MKTIVKQIATGTFIALFILVGNVKSEGAETKATTHKAAEITLQLEQWMTDENIWNTIALNTTEFVQETEAELELENWMTNSCSWTLNNSFAKEIEPELAVESWMIDENSWK
ncbi:hypothetical protein GM418_10585 [Maribellus comscasis]|uniref:Uncharacterized protein n=1 Tax=Maribellus comscasis TaxID=2681766 RepID=A0A6I6JME2_9BACT|nr:hypothetical protein [Maribellus comscasis]QGY44086.1 hypothetical protein GM418_10585 [Maribellus comscasis]